MTGQISESERLARVQLYLSENVGPATWHQMMTLYGSAEEALQALPELASRAGAGRRIKLCSQDRALRAVEATTEARAHVVTAGEDAYPVMLAQTDAPPPVLFVAGQITRLNNPAWSIVGSRNASANGCRFAREVSAELSRKNIMVVSGLARGIDTAAHQAALETGTIAVMATGLDVIYPAANAQLAETITETGCIVTEMPPGTKPKAELFPRRNRIIAGLSGAVVVVEAAVRSGSLITARLANELGRDVYAVPGSPYNPRAAGTNKLVQQGAGLLAAPGDVVELLDGFSTQANFFDTPKGFSDTPRQTVVSPSQGDKETVINLIGHAPVDVDELVRSSGMSLRQIQEVLLELDLAGRLERLPGQRVTIIA